MQGNIRNGGGGGGGEGRERKERGGGECIYVFISSLDNSSISCHLLSLILHLVVEMCMCCKAVHSLKTISRTLRPCFVYDLFLSSAKLQYLLTSIKMVRLQNAMPFKEK